MESFRADGRFFANGTDKTPSTFYLNRARPILAATFDKYYGFNITPDFGQGKVVLQDAYVSDDQFHGRSSGWESSRLRSDSSACRWIPTYRSVSDPKPPIWFRTAITDLRFVARFSTTG